MIVLSNGKKKETSPPVSPRKFAALEAKVRALEKNGENLRALAQGFPGAILVFGSSVLLHANKAAAKLFGYSSGAKLLALGNPACLFSPRELGRITVRGGKPGSFGKSKKNLQVAGLHRDGSRLPLEAAPWKVTWDGTAAVAVALSARPVFEPAAPPARQVDRMGYFSRSKDFFAVLEPDGTIRSASRAWLGSSKTKLSGKNLTELFPRQHRPAVRNFLAGMGSTSKERVAEFPIPGESGASCLQLRLTHSEKENGANALFLTARDVTAERGRAAELEARVRMLETVFQTIPAMVHVKDLDGRYVMVNATAAALMGKKAKAIVGLTANEVWPAAREELSQVIEADRRVLRTGKLLETPEERMTLPNGKVQWRRAVRAPLLDESGKITGIVSFRQDISESKRVGDELHKQQRLLQTVLDTIPHWVFAKDKQSRFVMANRAFAKSANMSPAGVIGLHTRDLQIGTAKDRKNFLKTDQKVMEDGEPLYRLDSITQADGTVKKRQMIKLPLRDEAGEVVGLVGIVEDITEKERMEATLRGRSRVLELLAEGKPLQTVLTVLAETMETINPGMLCSVLLVDKESGTLRKGAAPSLPDFYNDAIDGIAIAAGVGSCGAAAFSGKPVIAEDVRSHPNWVSFRELAERAGLRACWSFPVFSASREVLGTLALYYGKPRRPDNSTRELIADAAHLAGIAIERTKTEEQLRAGRRLLRTVFDTLPLGVYVKDRESRYVMVNEALAAPYGLSPESFKGLGISEDPTAGEEDRRIFRDTDRRVLETGEPLEQPEVAHILPDGSEHVLHKIKMPLRDDDGNVVGLVGITQDITERKKAEEELSANRRLLQAVIDGIPMWLFVKDRRGNYLMVNRKVADEVGVEPEDFKNLTPDTIPLGSPEERRKIKQDDEYVMTTGKRLDTESAITLPDGRQVLRHVIKQPLLDERGKVVGLLGIAEDITERKAIEDQLRQSQKMEAIGVLAGGIAHDFNNILFPIIGFTELTLEALEEDSREYENLTMVRDAANRARDIVSQILLFTRQSETKPETLNPRLLVIEALNFLQSTLAKNIVVRPDLEQDVEYIYADTTQFHQIVMNLCVNAAQAMPDGGTLTVSLGTVQLDDFQGYLGKRLSGEYVRLAVRDSGSGMDNLTQAQIFDPFYTTKPAGQGTGLGLSTVLGIVNEHQGAIKVTSAPGKGATFEVFLKAVPQPMSAAIPKASPESRRCASILFVDDEEAITQLVARILETRGHKVTALNDSLKALELFRSNPDAFHLIITDQMMPNMTGVQFAQAVREIRSKIPIILGTGYSEAVAPELALKLGIDDFFYKPVTVDTLVQLVDNVLMRGGAIDAAG